MKTSTRAAVLFEAILIPACVVLYVALKSSRNVFCPKLTQHVLNVWKNIPINVNTIYIKTENPVQILRRTDLMWSCLAKNKPWCLFLRKSLAKTGNKWRSAHTYTVHMFTHSQHHFLEWQTNSARPKAKSWEGYLTWQSMLRQFSNMVEQQSSIVLYCVPHCLTLL